MPRHVRRCRLQSSIQPLIGRYELRHCLRRRHPDPAMLSTSSSYSRRSHPSKRPHNVICITIAYGVGRSRRHTTGRLRTRWRRAPPDSGVPGVDREAYSPLGAASPVCGAHRPPRAHRPSVTSRKVITCTCRVRVHPRFCGYAGSTRDPLRFVTVHTIRKYWKLCPKHSTTLCRPSQSSCPNCCCSW